MSEARTSGSKYHVEIRDARGVVIGDNNIVYQYFLDERYRPLAEHLIAFDDLIAERIADFVGRAFLDARLATFMEQHDRGYFVLVGEPGIGKTAWAAHVVREHQALHHFNVSAMGIVRPDQALENLCAQLIARFQLDQPYLPVNAGRDGSLLDKLLRQAAERLDGSKLVIVIDALDEAQMPVDVRGTNAIYLPSSLPPGVYFVLTRRPQPMALETAPGTPSETFILGADLSDNQADVRSYLRQQAIRPEIAVCLAGRHISTERFTEELAERSAGNFMYLAYVLPDMASGLFEPLNLTGLPQGLRGYYERFWNELEAAKGEGREAWREFYKPVIGILAVAQEPVDPDWMGRMLTLNGEDVEDFAIVRWRKFLQKTLVKDTQCWQVYHASFRDFLVEKLKGAAKYHALICAQYRAACRDVWSELVELDAGYGLRHLAVHLDGAHLWDDLHDLVSEGTGDRQFWAEAKRGLEGSYAGYLADLAVAWRHADETGSSDFAAVGRQVKYALIESSLHSLAGKLHPTLLKALLIHKAPGWTAASALTYASQMSDQVQRSECLAALGPYLSASQYNEVLAIARATTDPGSLATLFGAIGAYLRTEQIMEALRLTHRITDDGSRALIVQALAPYLPSEIVKQELVTARTVSNVSHRVTLLATLAQFSPAETRETIVAEAFETVLTVSDNSIQTKLLVTLARSVKRDLADVRRAVLREALTAVEHLERNSLHISSGGAISELIALVPHLEADLLTEVLTVAENLSDMGNRSLLLATLAPHLPLTALPNAFRIARHLPLKSSRLTASPRIDALVALIPYLPVKLKDAAVREILIGLPKVKSPSQWVEAATLLPHIPEDQRQELAEHAGAAALQLRDLSAATRSLAVLVPHLSEKRQVAIVERILRGALVETSQSGQLNALMNLMPVLPSRLQKEILGRALASTREVGDAVAMASALIVLAPYLSSGMPIEVLPIVSAIKDERCRAEALGAIIPHLPSQILQHVLVMASEITTESLRARVLTEVVPHLPKEMIGLALAAAWEIKEVGLRADVLAILEPQLDERQFGETLAIAQAFWPPDKRALILSALAPRLPAEMLRRAYAEVQFVEDVGLHGRALVRLVPCLPVHYQKTAVKKMVMLSERIADPAIRSMVLAAVMPYLSRKPKESALRVALVSAQSVPDIHERERALIALVPHLPFDVQSKVLAEITGVEGAMHGSGGSSSVGAATTPSLTLPYFGETSAALLAVLPQSIGATHACTLKAWAEQWAEIALADRATAHEVCSQALHIAASKPRKYFLADLVLLLPLIEALGRDDTIQEVAQGILDVGRWWS